MMNVIERIFQIAPGTVIPKPATESDFRVKNVATRAGERALVYLIPNHKHPAKPYEKGIAQSEWQAAYECLMESGQLTREWFDENLPRCSNEGSCNFTTIGGVFTLLGLARYESRGVYSKIL